MKPIEEQVILLTGSTDGIGKITAQKQRRISAVLCRELKQARAEDQAYDAEARERLRRLSEALTGMRSEPR